MAAGDFLVQLASGPGLPVFVGTGVKLWDRLAALTKPWLRQKPHSSYGLPPLGGYQLDTALTVHVLTSGENAVQVLSRMSLFRSQLNRHQLSQLAKWAEATVGVHPPRTTLLAAVASTHDWPNRQHQEIGRTVSDAPQSLVQMVRNVLVAEQVFGERPPRINFMIAANGKSLQAALLALGEPPSSIAPQRTQQKISRSAWSKPSTRATVRAPQSNQEPQPKSRGHQTTTSNPERCLGEAISTHPKHAENDGRVHSEERQ